MSDNVIDHLTSPERFGTQTKLAEAAGVRPHTISEKRQTNSLTHAQMRRILIVAPQMGVSIRPDDFFPGLTVEAEPANDTSPSSEAA
ncbi:hypothetical protein [Brevundimonas diminuta]|uniref:hypothetical protein n=1 Tax=Brevundimonas diminuta TaxID=293 RepID=UPI000FE2265B|nr:hypothetical protein [Brevundimonas diminuta]